LLQQSGSLPTVVCGPFVVFTGVNCTTVLVPSNVIPDHVSSSTFGGNIGLGITLPISYGMKFYTETRYHYAPYHNVHSNLILLTVGVRW
jgi:hypothetical protein